MKHTGSFVRAGAIGIATFALLAASSAQADVGKAVVKAVRGTASYSVAGGAWEPLRVGKILNPGSKVRTEAASQVDLFLDQNGPVVRVTESTTLGLDKLNFTETGADTVIETQLDLSSGRILGNVKKMAAASTYEVKTLVGVAGIRGTKYDISANGTVKIPEGSATMGIPGRAPANVNSGQMFAPNTGVTDLTPQQIIDILHDMPPVGPEQGPLQNPAPPPQVKVNARPDTELAQDQERPYTAPSSGGAGGGGNAQ